MTENVGGFDRIARIVIGLGLVFFAMFGPAELQWKWIGYFGLVPLITGIVGLCPLYTLVGISTCPRRLRRR